jgi:hypothetical protein
MRGASTRLATCSRYGSAIVQFAWVPTLGVEYDLAVDRSGTTVRLYIDGAMVASGTLSGALFNSSADLVVGAAVGGTEVFTGSATAVRYTNGTARWQTDTTYSVPSLPLPTSA